MTTTAFSPETDLYTLEDETVIAQQEIYLMQEGGDVSMADVTVSISDGGASVSSLDTGLILIVSTDAVKDYTEYDISNGIAASGIDVDYNNTTRTYKQAAAVAAQVAVPQKIAVVGVSNGVITDEALETALNDMYVEHNSFFRMLTSTDATGTKLAVAKWAEANKKMPYIQYEVDNFVEDYSATNARLLYHADAEERLDAAEAGFASSRIPGTFILKFKEYVGITPTAIAPATISNIESRNMGYYIRSNKIGMQRSSKLSNWSVSKPKFVDDIESRYYLEKEIQDKLLTLLVNTEKLPGNVDGLQSIESQIQLVLQRAEDLEILNPFATDTTNAVFDKSTRKYSGIKFNYTYLHGVEEIQVTGEVQ